MSDKTREGEQFTGTRARFAPVDVKKTTVKYKYYYKVKHCQNEWTKIKTVEFVG